jgi:hypothetical protein
MTSLHQSINQENGHEQESAPVERLQSRWSASSRVIIDRPPSHPPVRRRMSGRPRNDSVNESRHSDDTHSTDNSRRGRSDSKWDSSSGIIADSPPLQPLSLSHRGSEILESTVLLEPVLSVDNADCSKAKSYGGIASTDHRLFHSYRTISNDGERRGGTAYCA